MLTFHNETEIHHQYYQKISKLHGTESELAVPRTVTAFIVLMRLKDQATIYPRQKLLLLKDLLCKF